MSDRMTDAIVGVAVAMGFLVMVAGFLFLGRG